MLQVVVEKNNWMRNRIKRAQVNKYLSQGKDFIDEGAIVEALRLQKNPGPKQIEDILAKSLSIKTLTLQETAALLNVRDLSLLDKMKETLNAKSAHIEFDFPYFIKKKAPVSGEEGLMEYQCRFIGYSNEQTEFIVGIKVPITTLCPCSKEISQYGAHSQRSYVNVRLLSNKFFWIEDIITIVERSGSADLYSLLKRPDEKFLTEKAYDNPMFVEDVTREVSRRLMDLEIFEWFLVESENIESIHNHSAYAVIEWGKRPETILP